MYPGTHTNRVLATKEAHYQMSSKLFSLEVGLQKEPITEWLQEPLSSEYTIQQESVTLFIQKSISPRNGL